MRFSRFPLLFLFLLIAPKPGAASGSADRPVMSSILSSSAAAASFSVTVEGSSIRISGLKSRASVALLSVAHEPAYYMTRVVTRRELLTDDDGDGTISYSVKDRVAFRSIWIVADVATGEVTIASPTGFTPLEMKQTSAPQDNAVNVVANTLDVNRNSADILVVRPGSGAWVIGVRGRGTEDAPGAVTSRLHIRLGKLQPLRADFGAAPSVLEPGDLMIVVDAEQMQFWMTKVDRGNN